MGVPGFYRWLVQRYPLVRRCLDDVSRPKINNLYIDFNCIVYNALRLVDTSKSFEDLFDEICRYLDLLVQIIQPQTVLFIAVDGPAPFAKCAQQRSRRFVAARDSKGGSFDTTSISVGTEFMEDLNQCLIKMIQNKKKEDEVWKKPQIIYSSHRVPGEGEHKFFDYIRSQIKINQSSTMKLTHCVYSPDADLIFLGLQTKIPNFYILREWDSWIGPHENVGNGKINKLRATSSDFELISLAIVREFMEIDYRGIPDVNRTIDDFAAFCFLIGNDFIPHFPNVSIQNGRFEGIIEAYQKAIMSKNIYLIEDGKINKAVLKDLLIEIVLGMSGAKKPKKGLNIQVDPEAASQKYLQEKYPNEYQENPQKLEEDLSFAVLDSFDWVFEYYTKGCPSWTWCFPYYYAPPLHTISKYCLKHQSKFSKDPSVPHPEQQPDLVENRPPYPLEQLLCILPPQSSKLLPESVAALMFEPSPIASFYPQKFEIDLNGRNYEHEGVVLIPFVNISLVREEVSKVVSELTPEEQKRNSLMEDLIFVADSYRDYDKEKDKPEEFDDPPCCIPSLHLANISFDDSTELCNIRVFNRPLKSPTILLHIKDKFQVPIYKQASDVQCLLNKPILVSWPYLRPALVTQIFDDQNHVFPKDEQIKDTKFKISQLVKSFKELLGIDIKDTTHIVFAVRPLISTRLREDQYRFQKRLVYYPYQLSLPCLSYPSVLSRFPARHDPSPEVGSLAVIIEGPNKSKLCKILSFDLENDEVKVEILNNDDKPLDLTDYFQNDENEWKPIDDIIERLRIPYDVVRPILTSIPLQGASSENSLNLAFTGFFEKRVLDGFCRKCPPNDHEFTKDYILQLHEYAVSDIAGQLLSVLRSTDNIEHLKSVKPEDIWDCQPAERDHKMKELSAFMKNSLPNKYFLIDDTISIISQTTLEKIERRIIEHEPLIENNDNEIVSLKLSDLMWPGKIKSFLQKCEIGSRVITLCSSGPIPFGKTGFVIGIDSQKSQYHIILNDECQYGTNLRKRLTTKRGYIAKVDDLFFY
ncbi:5'-3' exoribonuclease 1 [Tritrichomonas musculus]|uniref:5'-3' exoribonuclease 1 n=1 Tax=Tritrichomonas musculus TaxID=1915356 RepID=A0ABR2K2M5_9EUKA